QQVESFFGRQPLEHISPDEVVAIGAAIQASALTGAERRRAEIPRPPLPAARKSQALAQTMQIPSSSRKSEPPPLPKRRTSPGVRPGAQTSPGVYHDSTPGRPKTQPPGRRRDQTQPPMVIQPPEGMPQDPVPNTADGPGATRRRQTTGMGLGGPPPPPRTVGGLGARGRVPTGSGLGPAAEQARRVPTGSGLGPAAQQVRRVPTGSGLGAPEPPPRKRMPTGDYGTPGPANRARIPTGQGLGPSADAVRQRIPTGRGLGGEAPAGATLLSASDAAQSAQRASEKGDRISVVDSNWQENPPPLPLVGISDHEHEDLTVPATEAISAEEAQKLAEKALASSPKVGSAPDTAPAPLGQPEAAPGPAPPSDDELRAKYGNLPLIMPGSGAPKPVDKPTLESSQMPDLGDLADAALEDALEIPAEPEVPKPALGGTLMLSPEAAEAARPPFESAESRTAMELRQYAAPTSTDEVTLVRQAPTPPKLEGFEFEDELPVPDVPGPGDQPRVAKDPLGETVRREVPPGLGQTQALESPRRAPPPLNRTAQLDQPINLAETTRAAQSPFHQPEAPPPARPPFATTMGLGGAADPVIREMPAPPHPSAIAQPRAASPSSPLLVDVTPLSLTVETVSGYCDRVIQRNTPVPCEETRQFVTARDNQTAVRLRVSQGESSRFEDNTLLGELELLGLRSAPRGQVSIAVTFALDTNGMLNVSARDTQTGQATSAVIRLVGLPEQDIQALQARQQAHPM
ncbi:MAG: Hsp70 family protein, partial [Myxococcales bacterium]|nr:Hsp70 family protein [Myxococcales bacterium]